MPRGLSARTVIKQGVKYDRAKRKIALKRPSRALYTEEERKEMSRLRNRNIYYRKRVKALSNGKATTSKLTMKDLRPFISDVGSPSMATILHEKGYFDEPDYSERDIREWMISNGDEDLLKELIKDSNDHKDDVNSHLSLDDYYNSDVNLDKIGKYNENIGKNEARIDEIKQGAQNRKDEEMLKYMNEKAKIKGEGNLLQYISKGGQMLNAMSAPEAAAWRYLKNSIIQSVFNNIDFDKIDPEYVPIIKRTVYASIMENPLQGFRDAVKGNVALQAARKYGTEAGEFAGDLTDLVTSVFIGKPNLKVGVKSAFKYMVSKSPMNRALMEEVSNDLINAGESTNDVENTKMLTRDIAVDIGKDLIVTGGNMVAALPMIAKDIILDGLQADIRKRKYDKKELKEKAELDKIKKKAEEAQKKFKESGEQVDFSKIEEMFGVDLTEERAEQIFNTKL